MAHTYSKEHCIDCDSAYHTYVCMIQGDSDSKILDILKLQYEIGQQDPRPFNAKASDVTSALDQIRELMK